jgi:hypothetical protein
VKPQLDPAEARRIIAETYSEIEKSSKVPVKAAIYNKLCEAGMQDLAEILMFYSAMEGAMSMSGAPSYTFNISGTVGNLNLGEQIGQITTSLTVVSKQGTGAAEFAQAVKSLTDEVLRSEDLGDPKKKEAIEALEFISQQAVIEPEKRKSGMLKIVVESVPKILSTVASGAAIWAKYGDHIRHFLGF